MTNYVKLFSHLINITRFSLNKDSELTTKKKMNQATDLFTSLVSEDNFEEFLTVKVFDQLD